MSQPRLPNGYNALVVENDAASSTLYRQMLAMYGFDVVTAVGMGRALVADARARAAGRVTHLATLDMRLYDDSAADDTLGIELIQPLKPTVSVVVTGYGSPSTASDTMRKHGAFHVINKLHISERLEAVCAEAVSCFCLCAASGQPHWHPLAAGRLDGPVLSDRPPDARDLAWLLRESGGAAVARALGQLLAALTTGEAWAAYHDRLAAPATLPLADYYLPEQLPEPPALAALPPGLDLPALPDPVAWVRANRAASALPDAGLAVCHRALRSADLAVDAAGAVWIAQLNRADLHHRLYDLVCLELDLLTELDPGVAADLQGFYELAVAAIAPATPDAPLRPTRRLLASGAGVYVALAGLREAARRSLPYADERERLWGLLLETVRRLLAPAPAAPLRARLQLLGGLLCARLQRWEQPGAWLRPGWPAPVLQAELDYREALLVGPLFRHIRNAECCTVLELPHVSRLRLLQQFIYRSDVLQRYLGARAPETLVVPVNCDRMLELNERFFFELLLTALVERAGQSARAEALRRPLTRLRKQVLASDSALLAQRNLEHAVALICRDHGMQLCLVLDRFDRAYHGLSDQLFSNLYALADAHWGQLSFVLGLRDTLRRLRTSAPRDGFESLFSYGTLAVMPDEPEEARAALREYEERAERALTPAQRDWIIERSGGHAGLTLALFQALHGQDRAQERAWLPAALAHPDVQRECSGIWACLARDERQLLRAAAAPGGLQADEPGAALLAQKGLLLADSRTLRCRILGDYAATQPSDDLLQLDARNLQVRRGAVSLNVEGQLLKLLQYLYEQRGRSCDHDELLVALYGNKADTYSKEGLQQLVKRTRLQIEPDPKSPKYLLTVNQFGYRLVGTDLYPLFT